MSVSQQQQKLQWDKMKEGEKNILVWPDFLQWSAETPVEVTRSSAGNDLGITTVAVQESGMAVCYNIVIDVIDGRPAKEKVNKCDWITAIDGKSTLGVKGNQELIKMTKNGKKSVMFSVRKPSRPLENVKLWSGVKTKVDLDCCSTNLGFRLHHLYSKEKNGSVEDHILVYAVTAEKVNLNRGDRVLSINDKPVAGKRLKEIHQMFFNAGNVSLEIHKIFRGKEFEDKLQKTAVKSPDKIYWGQSANIQLNGREPSLGFILNSCTAKKNSSDDEVFHVVSKVFKDSPASRTNLSVGSRILSVNGHDLTGVRKTEAASLIKREEDLKLVIEIPEGIKQYQSRRRKSSLKLQGMKVLNKNEMSNSSSSSPKEGVTDVHEGHASSLSPTKLRGMAKIDEYVNDAYNSSDCSQDNADICSKCVKEKKDRLPDDKLLWPINKLDHESFRSICEEMDKKIYKSGSKDIAHYLGFSRDDIEKMYQQFSEKGGIGASKDYLDNWTIQDKRNTVGKFRDILAQLELPRNDIIEVINKACRKKLCHACGCLMVNK